MGLSVSRMASSEYGKTKKTSLGDLPECCVASILVHLDPTDISRLAGLNKAFSGAANSDSVWTSKLPLNYKYLLDKASMDANNEVEDFKTLTQKEIYAHLCSPKIIDDSTKIFSLEKKKGEVCMLISAKALSITGIDDRRYWNYIPNDNSRFNTVAYLQQTWWFQVDGEIDFCFPAGTYSLFYRVFLGRPSQRFGWRTCDTSHVHGWDKKPVRFELSTSCGQQAIKQCYLLQQENWVHYHVGDFSIEDSNIPTKVKFSMMQIDCTHTKGGLCMDSVLIYPKGYTRPRKPFAI